MGTIPLREQILPVIDLSIWLNLEREPQEHELVVVTEIHKRVAGYLVSGVTQIHRLSWEEVRPPGAVLGGLPENCITGMVDIGERFVLLVDLERMLTELDSDYQTGGGDQALEEGEAFSILIVDDSYAVRGLLGNIFEEAGFEVTTANDGADAWEKVKAAGEKAREEGKGPADVYNAIIADVEMPRMDGYTLTKKIKEDSFLRELPVVLFSSLISESIRHKGESVGADDQVTKPEFSTLAERMVSLIRRKRKERQAG